MLHKAFVFAAPLGVALALFASSSHAQDTPPLVEPDAPDAQTAFKGRAIYVGLGAGMITDLHVPTENWRIQATIPVARWAAIELFPYGYHFMADGHHGPESVQALGIGTGFRVAPFPTALIRPYIAARFSHIHMWPDPWGDHEGAGGDSYSHTSHHRWAGALAGGFDAPLGRKSKFRLGVELEGTAATGPGTNGAVALMGMLGYAL